MSDQNGPSAMRRKAGAGRPPPEIGRVTAATALRVAVAQAAEDVAALVALAAGVDETRIVRGAALEAAPEHALLGLIEGPASSYGLAVMDPQALAALIEIQTTGRVVPNPAEPRAPTRTDAILAADFIDRVLELFEDMVGEADLPLRPAISGFRYALPMADARAVEMTLEDIPYRQFNMTLDLGSGAKNGVMQLIFPWDPPRSCIAAVEDRTHAALGDQVMETEAEMIAILHRLDLSLAEVTELTVGCVVPVPRDALNAVLLTDVMGEAVSHGRLGQVSGHRAVRLCETCEEVLPRTGARPDTQGVELGTDQPITPPKVAQTPPNIPASKDLPPLGDLTAPLADAGGVSDLPDMDALSDRADLPEPVG
ncbi:flagellar motor switch protein FliM [Aliiroseovarius subalbicans]|uniref:FliM/FliN family flagellar motor switch protein n=1 Tax=Aliiroseovarius subalbicans TaxID=2925840 RepID=UPI001F58FFFE|nr:flagellar motor switch protein FliM [Aliiroseovarius subalbicans]MCI2398997.1 FliM/FliN family flagellar motor switch protein [Aliiroseovarius subalbicans]